MTARPTSTRDLQPWFTTAIDIAGCKRLELVVHLYEHEQARVAFETWPDAVRAKALKYFEEWAKDNPTREVVAVTYAVAADDKGRQCVVIVHHAAIAEQRKRKPKPETKPDAPAPAPVGGGGPSTTPAAACAACSE